MVKPIRDAPRWRQSRVRVSVFVGPIRETWRESRWRRPASSSVTRTASFTIRSAAVTVTLEQIADMIRSGEDVKIVDNNSKEDLTAITLTQIIFEEEKKQSFLPLSALRNIIQSGANNITQVASQAGERMRGIFKRGEGENGESAAEMDEAGRRQRRSSHPRVPRALAADLRRVAEEGRRAHSLDGGVAVAAVGHREGNAGADAAPRRSREAPRRPRLARPSR